MSDRTRHPIGCAAMLHGVTAHGANCNGTVCRFDQVLGKGAGHEEFGRRYNDWCASCPKDILKIGGVDYWAQAQERISAAPCGAC